MSPSPILVRDLGMSPYLSVVDTMRTCVESASVLGGPETLLVVTHPPVITVGRHREARQHIVSPGQLPVVEVDRGGDVTYHGPGQIVLYPICRLEGRDRDLHRVLRNLENSVIGGLAALGVSSYRDPELTGVWAGGRKIAAIGIAVRKWVMYHGVALNLAPDENFNRIRGCGLDSRHVGSLAEVTGRSWAKGQVAPALIAGFAKAFDRMPMSCSHPDSRPS